MECWSNGTRPTLLHYIGMKRSSLMNYGSILGLLQESFETGRMMSSILIVLLLLILLVLPSSDGIMIRIRIRSKIQEIAPIWLDDRNRLRVRP